MTDEQIIKALEHCSQHKCNCECPKYYDTTDVDICRTRLIRSSLDLITRQKAEISVLRKLLDKAETEMNNQSENIKKLTKDCYSMQSTLAKMSMGVEQAKVEAIKEFADKLKTTLAGYEICFIENQDWSARNTIWQASSEIDNLVKEMVGDTE